MIEDNIVIDTSNYKSSYSEPTPFKAKVEHQSDMCVVVTSITTKKEYELYFHQIFEGLEIDKISKMIDMSKYGSNNG